jgi:regulator of sirC expression with transglutaminase-like and TPR domain
MATDVATDFATLVSREDDRIDLVRAALTIARTEYPELDMRRYILQIEALACRVRARVRNLGDPAETIPVLNEVLFQEEGFRGNREDYYDPRNSFLNEVLDRRLGIPITLALVYMEVARRSRLRLLGVGMPGHFLLKHYDPEGHETLIDVFNQGSILSAADCQQRLDEIYSGQMTLHSEFLMPVSRRQMLTRMLNNLKTIYLSARNFRKALPVIDLVLAIYPRSPEDVKNRAVLRYNMGQMRGAVDDFELYLRMSPEASDADEIRATALSLRRGMASMN